MNKTEIVLGAPPAAIAGSKLIFGYTLPEWAAIITIIYTGALLLLLLVRGGQWAWGKWRDWHLKDDE